MPGRLGPQGRYSSSRYSHVTPLNGGAPVPTHPSEFRSTEPFRSSDNFRNP